jgi:hypothetical protein
MVESASVREMPVRVDGPRPPGFWSWVSLLVHAHRERLLSYARRHGLDAEEELDVVQDSFISFLELPEAHAIAHASSLAIVRHSHEHDRSRFHRHTHAPPRKSCLSEGAQPCEPGAKREKNAFITPDRVYRIVQ